MGEVCVCEGGVSPYFCTDFCVSLNFMYSLFVINSSLKPRKRPLFILVCGENVERLRLKPPQVWEEEEEEGGSQAVAHTGSLHHRSVPLQKQPLKGPVSVSFVYFSDVLLSLTSEGLRLDRLPRGRSLHRSLVALIEDSPVLTERADRRTEITISGQLHADVVSLRDQTFAILMELIQSSRVCSSSQHRNRMWWDSFWMRGCWGNEQ